MTLKQQKTQDSSQDSDSFSNFLATNCKYSLATSAMVVTGVVVSSYAIGTGITVLASAKLFAHIAVSGFIRNTAYEYVTNYSCKQNFYDDSSFNLCLDSNSSSMNYLNPLFASATAYVVAGIFLSPEQKVIKGTMTGIYSVFNLVTLYTEKGNEQDYGGYELNKVQPIIGEVIESAMFGSSFKVQFALGSYLAIFGPQVNNFFEALIEQYNPIQILENLGLNEVFYDDL